MCINEDLAELWGLHAGNGSLYNTNKSTVWELRDNHDEKEFYDTHVISLLKRLHQYPFEGKIRSGGKNGCYGIRCCNKQFHALLLKGGFTPGRKTKTVQTPQKIMRGTTALKKAFLRGLFAADG